MPLAAWSLLVSLLAGCANVEAPYGPDLSAVHEGAVFRNAEASSVSLDTAWWRVFADPMLSTLVERAEIANQDVLIAAQRVRQARAGSTAAASRLLPTLALTASASDTRTGAPDEIKRGLPDTRAYRGALDVGWELDAFGAARAAADAADFDAQAADAGVGAAHLLATTEVARQYAVWQGARWRLLKLEALLQSQRDTEKLTRSRLAEGQASRFDVARAAGETESLTAQLPPLRALVAVTEHQIAVLLGSSPSAQVPGLDANVTPALPDVPALASGQPAELLTRRPDLRAAERQLMAEAARLREARADLWPKFFLAAVLGREDLRLNLMDLSPVRYSNVALAFAMPVFNAGRLRAAVERQSAREHSAALQYERAVLAALQDVENSLVALTQERARGAALDAAAAARRTGLRYAESLYREGQIDLLQLLDAQRGLLAAELAVIDSRTQRVINAVQLVKAMGGGWRVAPADPVASNPTTHSLMARQP